MSEMHVIEAAIRQQARRLTRGSQASGTSRTLQEYCMRRADALVDVADALRDWNPEEEI